ncbi:MAG: hypothetical protein ucyna2_00413 [Candidatus Atelocyanobacterium thalassa isolate SIO64986]|uniref:Uncharacterized protein n=1 Tax=Candidatus Atelocyanobacterium thalassa isolate SIO64986 TaxID=1527444 RepID=A0A086CHX0_9CHRO|nr:MAG: hypothetical protein ucyna2_00413 [Candidatus Atelocyanobacterium thalassa isolate SIO64986]
METQQRKFNLITNVTGEPYQPTRLYYNISNKESVLNIFRKLQCTEFDPSSDRWYWFYSEEAKKIRFEKSYNKISKESGNISLGYFIFLDNQTMILEARSFQRVLAAINFFKTRLNWRIAEPVKLRLINKLFSCSPEEKPEPPSSFAEFFDQDNKNIVTHNPEDLAKEIELISSQHKTETEKDEAIASYMANKSKRPLSEIEEITVSVHDHGLSILEMALKMRQIEAWEHWQGNEHFTQHDLIQKILENIPDHTS